MAHTSHLVKGAGELSVSVSQGRDNYDYVSRAALVRQTKEDLGIIDEMEPIPSPWTLEIEPTLRCNSRCFFCSYQKEIFQCRKFAGSDQMKPDLSRSIVAGILESVRSAGTTKGVYWSGGGETLLWPHFSEMVKLAASFSDNFVQTNGILLDKYASIPENLAAIRLLSVSVFADNPSMYFLIGGVRAFDVVVKGIEKVVSLKKQYGLKTMINVKVMINTLNYRDVPEIVRFYENLNVDSIGLRLVQDYNYGGVGKRSQSVELSQEQKNELAGIIDRSSYENDSLYSFAQTLENKTNRGTRTQHCYNAIDGHFACVDTWGRVYLGNPEIGDNEFSIGNVNDAPWLSIWKGPKHYEVLRSMDRAQQSGACQSSLCRHIKANIGGQKYVEGEIGRQDQGTVLKNLGAFL